MEVRQLGCMPELMTFASLERGHVLLAAATYYFDVFSRKYIQSLDLHSDKEAKKA